jgi:hypothetical protein
MFNNEKKLDILLSLFANRRCSVNYTVEPLMCDEVEPFSQRTSLRTQTNRVPYKAGLFIRREGDILNTLFKVRSV